MSTTTRAGPVSSDTRNGDAAGTPGLVGRARCTGVVVPANAVSCGPDATAAAALARAAGGRGSSRRQAVRALTSRAIGTAIAGRVIAVYTPPLQVAVEDLEDPCKGPGGYTHGRPHPPRRMRGAYATLHRIDPQPRTSARGMAQALVRARRSPAR